MERGAKGGDSPYNNLLEEEQYCLVMQYEIGGINI